jgi:hypothetical protein
MAELDALSHEKEAFEERQRRIEDVAKVIESTISWAVGKMEFALTDLLIGKNKIDTEILYFALMKNPKIYASFIVRNFEVFEKYISPEDLYLLS